MRVLLTGTSRVMTNSRRFANFRTNITYLRDMLELLGHTVDWRTVEPGEAGLQDRYDIALTGLQAINSFVGQWNQFGTLWAASQLPHIVVFGDWQIRASCYSLKLHRYLWQNATVITKEGMRLWEKATLFEDVLDAQRMAWYTNLGAVIAPLFPWGDHAKFMRIHNMDRLYALDPTNFTQVLTRPTEDQEKRKAWVCAALADQNKWTAKLNLQWPLVRQHGTAGKRGWGRISEDEVVNGLYRTHWGVLAPRQGAMSGTGWWRSRYIYAAQARSVFWADPREVIGLGGPYLSTMQLIEGLSDKELRRLADDQRDHLYEKSLGQAAVLDILYRALKTEIALQTSSLGVT
jgi:hypothetical protein